ncbi:MAG: hypothetical protein AAGA00_02905 [Pseudomonadota bacterium]
MQTPATEDIRKEVRNSFWVLGVQGNVQQTHPKSVVRLFVGIGLRPIGKMCAAYAGCGAKIGQHRYKLRHLGESA